jgi:hypothetical protein
MSNDSQPIRLPLPTVPPSVPVFNCVVHVRRDEHGNVHGRVANLPDLVCTAATERDLLAKIVKEFKRVIRECSEKDSPIPWVDPPKAKEPSEQTRLIPVHL